MKKRLSYFQRASAMPADYCFPARLEEMVILEYARELLPQDGRIAYYLGNLYYDKKRYAEAIAGWEIAVQKEPGFSIPWRNLGIAAYNVQRRRGQSPRSVMKKPLLPVQRMAGCCLNWTSF